jgi:hypothetical protein
MIIVLVGVLERAPYWSVCKRITVLVSVIEGAPYQSACWKGITLLVGVLEGDHLIGRRAKRGSPYWSAC